MLTILSLLGAALMAAYAVWRRFGSTRADEETNALRDALEKQKDYAQKILSDKAADATNADTVVERLRQQKF